MQFIYKNNMLVRTYYPRQRLRRRSCRASYPPQQEVLADLLRILRVASFTFTFLAFANSRKPETVWEGESESANEILTMPYICTYINMHVQLFFRKIFIWSYANELRTLTLLQTCALAYTHSHALIYKRKCDLCEGLAV